MEQSLLGSTGAGASAPQITCLSELRTPVLQESISKHAQVLATESAWLFINSRVLSKSRTIPHALYPVPLPLPFPSSPHPCAWSRAPTPPSSCLSPTTALATATPSLSAADPLLRGAMGGLPAATSAFEETEEAGASVGAESSAMRRSSRRIPDGEGGDGVGER